MKIILLFVFYVFSLFAHPHTFIEVYPTLKVKNDSTFTVKFKWVLDDMTSTILIMELDSNANGTIEDSENKYIFNNYFSMFKEYHYYTYLNVKGHDKALDEPKNFRATIENHRICYSFEVDIDANVKDTKFTFGDESYYVAMVLKKEFIEANEYETQVSRVENDRFYGHSLVFK